MRKPQRLPISVCMIVRNEEKHLAEALKSVCDLVGEVIVVDTGSHDRTMEIAREFGAKLLEFPWQDDFSLARNVALQAANFDWILSLDADQRLPPNSQKNLAAALTSPHMAQIVTICAVADDSANEQLGSYTALRLFRRDAKIRYQGRIHESIAESLLKIGSTEWPDSQITLLDVGYSSATERQRKKDRNLLLLERSRAENPNDLFVAYKLALTLPASRNLERNQLLFETISTARSLPEAEIRTLPFMHRLLATAVDAYVEQGRLCEAADIALSLLPRLGSSCYFTAGRAAARTGQTQLAFDLLTHYLTIDTQPIDLAVQPDPDANSAEACRWLGWLSYMAGNFSAAENWLQKALQTAKPDQQAAIECEKIRINIAMGHLAEASRKIEQLFPLATNSSYIYKELMLVSAELSNAIGDQNGARELAQAALSPTDDRAAALLATLELKNEIENKEQLSELMTAVVGRRYDLLAIRSMLATALGLSLGLEMPLAAHEYIFSQYHKFGM